MRFSAQGLVMKACKPSQVSQETGMVPFEKQDDKVQEERTAAFTGATINRYGQHLTAQNGPNSITETTDEHLRPGQKLLKLEQGARSPGGRL